MEIQGLNRFIRTLNNASNNFDEEATKSLNKISQKLIAKVKLKTPVGKVKGGTLRRSWRVKKDGQLARIVYNNVHYAPYIEYGHRTRGGKSFVDGRYMLTKSVQEIEGTLTSEFSMMIENLFNE
mgnify:CR=1 FL=1